MIPELFLVVAAWGAFSSVIANVRAKRPVLLGLLFTITGFFTAELARFHIAVQLAATAVWVAFGALEEAEGWWGLGLVAISVALLELAHRRGRHDAVRVARALEPTPVEAPVEPVPRRLLLHPFDNARPGVTIDRDLRYGEHPRNRYDLHLPADHMRSDPQGAPILLQIHGGGWVTGRKEQQGQPLLATAGEQGWIGVAINYPLGPKTRFPEMFVHVKRAIAHVKAEAPGWGGDPDRLVVTGGSAGGHLTALAALTGDDPLWQPGFEDADCSVAAAVPFYGVYDLTDRNGHRGRGAMTPFLERMVMSTKLADDPDGWDAVSPIARVRPDAPPMMVIGCGLDTLVPIEETRDFVEVLRDTCEVQPVYVELPYAHHAFDIIASPRTLAVTRAVTAWARHAVTGAHTADG